MGVSRRGCMGVLGRGREMMVREEGEEEMGLGSAALLEEGEAWRLRGRRRRDAVFER